MTGEAQEARVDTPTLQEPKVPKTPKEIEAEEQQEIQKKLERWENTKKALEAQLWKLETLTPAWGAGRDILIRTLNQMLEKKGINGVSFGKQPDGKIIPKVEIEKGGMNSLEQVDFIVTGNKPTENLNSKQPDAYIDVDGKEGYTKWQDIGYFAWGKVEWTLDASGNVLDTGAKKEGRNVGEMNLSPEWHQLYKVSNNGYFRDIKTFITTFGKQLGIPEASLWKLPPGSVVGPDDKWIIAFKKWTPGKWTLEQQWVTAVNSPKMPGNKQIDITSFMEALQIQEVPKMTPPVVEKAPDRAPEPDAYGRFYTSGNVEHFDIDDTAMVSYKNWSGTTKEYKWTDLGITAENVNDNTNDEKSEFTKLKSSDGSTILIGEWYKDKNGKVKEELNLGSNPSVEEIKSKLKGRKIEAWAIKPWVSAPEVPKTDSTSEKPTEAPKQKTIAIEEIGDKDFHTMTMVTSPERGKDKLHPIGLKQIGNEYVSMFQDGNEKKELKISKAELDDLNPNPTKLPKSLEVKLNEKPNIILWNQPLYLQIPGVWANKIDLGISLVRSGDNIEVKAESQDNPLTKIPGIKSVTPDGKITFHPTDKRPEITLQAGKDGSLKLEKGEINVLEGKQTPREFFSQTPKKIQNLLLEKYTVSIKKPEAAPAAKAVEGTPKATTAVEGAPKSTTPVERSAKA